MRNTKMKKSLYNLYFLLIIGLIASPALAVSGGKLDVEKRKTVEKAYDVKSNVLLNIMNKFGKVHVNTWDKATIEVKVEIIARRNNENRAQELLDRIRIDISESSSEIMFETEFRGNFNSKSNESYEINYNINMPRINPLRVKNSFGDTFIADIDSNVDLKLSYGDVRLENLNGTDNEIKISFSDGDIKSIKQGVFEAKYSDLNVDEVGVIKLENGFSDISIDKAKTIDLTSKYGDLEIGYVEGVKGYVGFTDFSIDRLEFELDVEASYAGDFTVEEVGKNFTKVFIDGKFGDYDIGFEDGANGTLEATMKYCDMDFRGINIDLNYRVKEDFRATYRGKIGDGSGGKVDIYSSYGDVRLR